MIDFVVRLITEKFMIESKSIFGPFCFGEIRVHVPAHVSQFFEKERLPNILKCYQLLKNWCPRAGRCGRYGRGSDWFLFFISW